MAFKHLHASLIRRCPGALLTLLIVIATPGQASAFEKINVIMLTQESMQEHTSDEPRRLMCEVLLHEFAKGGVLQVVNQENSSTLLKVYHAKYHVGANLIAFSFSQKDPMNVSISIQLLDKKSGNVFLTSDRAMFIDENLVQAALKLDKAGFENSAYGKALTILSRAAAVQFQERVKQLNPPPPP